MSNYEINKEKAREEAVDWQLNFHNHNYDYEDLMIFSEHFTKLAKRYGLMKEFKENGII